MPGPHLRPWTASFVYIFCFALATKPFPAVRAEIVGALVIPHGDFSYAPELLPHNSKSRAAAEKVHSAAISLAKMVSELNPDVIFLSTPHGTELSNDFATYLNSNGSGFAAIGSDLHNKSRPPNNVPLTPHEISLSPNISLDLTNYLRSLGQNVSGIKSFADSEPAALRWGEVVPLLFIPEAVRNSTRTIIWSQPLRRYKQSAEMVDELLQVGRLTGSFLNNKVKERVLVIISSDLAHTHLASGPYGYSNASEPFDLAISQWLENPYRNSDALLHTARNLEDRALSCGFTGLVLLHGMLFEGPGHWDTKLLANEHPTYYGMAVGTVTKAQV